MPGVTNVQARIAPKSGPCALNPAQHPSAVAYSQVGSPSHPEEGTG